MSITAVQPPLWWESQDASAPGPRIYWSAAARRAAWWLLTGVLALAALTVACRRLAGSLEAPLPPWAMLLTGALVATAGGAARLASAAGRPAFELLISALVVTLGLAISLPGSSGWALAGLWGCVVVEEAWAWTRTLRRRHHVAPLPVSAAEASPAPGVANVEEQSVLLQHLVRRRTASGVETATGWLRVDFAPGQRTEIAHVSFCPPFAATPRVTLRQKTGPAARIRDSQRLPYGLRLEVKLVADAVSPTSVEVEFSAEG